MATLTTSYQKLAEKRLGSNNYGDVYVRVYAKYNSQSIANNTSSVSYQSRLYISRGSLTTGTTTQKSLSGTGASSITNANATGTYNTGETTLSTITGTVTHNNDGTKSVSTSAKFYSSPWGFNGTASADATLPTIPRYASITKFEVNKRDETSFTVNWGASAACDAVWYSINNGNWVSTSGTSFIISGLSANTTYNVKIRVRRTDSQLTTDSSNVSQTTYNYPHITTTPNFTIGNAVTLSLYNPLSRNCTVTMYGDDWSTIYSGSGWTGTTVSPFNTETIVNNLYSSIPDKQSGTYHIKVMYNNVARDKVNAGTYSIKGDEKPTFNDFDYEDTNSDIIDLTGNNQILVDNYSTCKFSIPTRAIAKNGARIDSYVCYYGDNYITYLEQNIADYWKKIHEDRFALNFDSSTNINEIACTGASGWECLYFPIKTVAGKTYKFTFDYRNPNGYTPLSGQSGIPCQILTRVDDSNNTGNQISYITLDPTANQSTQHLEIQFTATTNITYINFNFGFAADGVTTTIYLGNFKLNDINGTGNMLKVQAIDSRGLSTTVTKTITNIPYKNAFINELSTERKDGVDSKTFLAGKFTIYNGSWNNSGDDNSQNRLKYVGYSVYKNNAWSNYYDITNAIVSAASVRTDGNNKIYEFDYNDEVQIHENGTSGGFALGTEFPIKVLIKDGNNSYVFTPTNYEALFNTNVSDGTVATCLHKDRNGLYHLGINCMSSDSYMVMANDNPIIDNNGKLIVDEIESGSNSNGSWIKYPDGTMICWQKQLFENYQITGQQGNLYETSLTPLDYPVAFVGALPSVSRSIEYTNWTVFGFGADNNVNASLTNSGSFKLFRGSSTGTGTVNTIINTIAIGRWK